MTKSMSELENARAEYKPAVPAMLENGVDHIGIEEGEPTTSLADQEEVKEKFPETWGHPRITFVKGDGLKDKKPLKVGVVLSGGQAPGGHNVITGIFDGIRAIHPESKLYGFLGGPRGIFTENYEELTAEKIAPYRNTGGFDMIGSGRDKIESPEHLAASKEACEKIGLDALVIIGGDDSNTNAAVLAEYFEQQKVNTSVIGVPKTIDGDLKNESVEVSFGFDTASKVYSELIGNICRDSKSARKYWHFVKLMGRNASHVTLECALQTHPNITLIGEEVNQKNMTLAEIVRHVANVVRRRAEEGKNFGVCLVPEGLIEFIPEIRALIGELNEILAKHDAYFKTIKMFSDQQEFVSQKLSRDSSYVFSSLPARIQQQLLYDRDSHGNVQVSKIETEKLIIEQVSELLAEWKAEGKFEGKFSTQSHFLGYEGRCAIPSNFDANYTYTLGQTAAALIAFGKTGYMCCVGSLTSDVKDWKPGGVPITSLLNMETRKGKRKPVIKKALVELDSEPFRVFEKERKAWETEDDYVYPGAIQYFGPSEVSDAPSKTLILEQK